MKSLIVGILAVFVCFLTGSVDQAEEKRSGGSIEGTVELAPRSGAVRTPFAGRYQRRSEAGQPESVQAVLVWLEAGEVQREEGSDEPVILDQVDLQFVPDILAVRKGEKVRIINSDPVYHNVFSFSSVKRFDVGRRPQGEHYDVTFERQGMIDVFCDIHSDMHAVIYVVSPETLTWKRTEPEELFRFENLDAGTYTLNIFSPGYEHYSQQVEVNGESVQLGSIRLTS